mgnify:CR=1 FL=1
MYHAYSAVYCKISGQISSFQRVSLACDVSSSSTDCVSIVVTVIFSVFFTKKELFLVVLFEILVQSHIPANPESCRTSPWNWVPKLNVLLMMHYSLFVAIIYVTLWFRSYQRTYQRPKRNCSVVIHQCSTLYVWRSGLSVLFSNTFQVTEALVLANTRGIRER